MTHSLVIMVAMAATVGALFLGLIGFLTQSTFYKKHGNALMRWRVFFQGAALLAIFLMAAGS